MIRIITQICIFMLVMTPIIVSAQIFNVEADGEYVMGDNDTKIEARRMALEHAKRTASEQAGSYLESTTTVKDLVLTNDEIRSVTAAIIQTTVLSEGITLLENKTTQFVVRVKASVDTSALNSKILELQKNGKTKEQLVKLQNENLNLLRRLDDLSRQFVGASSEKINKIHEERDALFQNIDKNNKAIHIALTKGALLKLALNSQEKLESDKTVVDKIMSIIAESVKVEIGSPEVSAIGDKSEVSIPVKWSLDRSNLKDMFALWNSICKFTPTRYSRHGHTFEETFTNDDTYNRLKCISRQKYPKDNVNEYINYSKIEVVINVGSHQNSFYVKEGDGINFEGSRVFKADFLTSELIAIDNIDAQVKVRSGRDSPAE